MRIQDVIGAIRRQGGSITLDFSRLKNYPKGHPYHDIDVTINGEKWRSCRVSEPTGKIVARIMKLQKEMK